MKNSTEILEKINKLLALAGNNPSKEEAEAAMLKAQELMLKYHVENPETIEEDKVISVYFDLKDRKKTETILLISVLVAKNFRCKTVHSGQKIYFLGLDADAKAAVRIFVYVLNFADESYRNYFMMNTRTEKAAANWKFGFVAGLDDIFSSRHGFELMTYVPRKVLEVFDELDTTDFEAEKTYPTQIHGAFTEGFKKGRESMMHKELDGVTA